MEKIQSGRGRLVRWGLALTVMTMVACMLGKEKDASERELRVYLPDGYRNGDTLLLCLEDSLGFVLDTLWDERFKPRDSVLIVNAPRATGEADRISLGILRGRSATHVIRLPIPANGIIDARPRDADDAVIPHALPDTLLDSACNLSWSGGDSTNPETYWRIRLGTSDAATLPVYQTGLRGRHAPIEGLSWGTSYKWQVERLDGPRLTQGPVGTFMVRQDSPRLLDYGSKQLAFPIGIFKLIPYQAYRGGKARFTVTPELPQGISLNPNEGTLSGMARDQMGPLPYKIRARNAYGECSATVTLLTDSMQAGETGLVAYWDFEDSKGDILRDRSGNGLNGVIRDGEWTNGVRGGGLWFNGSSTRVTVPFDTLLNLPKYTLEAWIRTVKTNGDQTIIDRVLPDGTKWNYRMLIPGRDWTANGNVIPKGVVQADVRNNFATSYEEIVFGKTYIPDGRWHHIVVTNRARLITIYVDGKKDIARVAGPQPDTTTRRELLLGDCDFTPVDFKFEGAMDEVRIYDYDLDSVEVRRRFESFPVVPIIPR